MCGTYCQSHIALQLQLHIVNQPRNYNAFYDECSIFLTIR